MKRRTSVLHHFLIVTLLAAWLPHQAEAKSYSSGSGRSYSSSSSRSSGSTTRSSASRNSSSSRSSSSSGSPSRSSSAGTSASKSSSSSSSRSFGSSSGKSYSSSSTRTDDSKRSYSSGKSYGSSPGRVFSSGPKRDNTSSKSSTRSSSASDNFTFDSAAARARKEEASRQQFTRYKESQPAREKPIRTEVTPPPGTPSRSTTYGGGSLRRTVYVPDVETLTTRPVRVETVFRPYYTRPVVRYGDSYDSFFWWWLLDRSLDDRARWAYHHRSSMDTARYQALVEHEAELESRIEQLEAEQVVADANYVPRGIDRDLMYSDQHIQRAYSNRPTTAGRVSFWILAAPTALGMGCFLVWLVFFKRWQVST